MAGFGVKDRCDLEAGRAGARAGEVLVGAGRRARKTLRETRAGRPWREETGQAWATPTGREKQLKRDRKYSWAETGEMEAGETAGRGALPGWLLSSARWRRFPFFVWKPSPPTSLRQHSPIPSSRLHGGGGGVTWGHLFDFITGTGGTLCVDSSALLVSP